jgi:hypothetical protein
MARKARPHGATALPCVLGYRAAALRGKVAEVVSDETIQRELNKKLIYECRCDERLKAKAVRSTRLPRTVLLAMEKKKSEGVYLKVENY